MYFSIKTQSFYVNDDFDKDILPDDAVEVSAANETKIRENTTNGKMVSTINSGKLTFKAYSPS